MAGYPLTSDLLTRTPSGKISVQIFLQAFMTQKRIPSDNAWLLNILFLFYSGIVANVSAVSVLLKGYQQGKIRSFQTGLLQPTLIFKRGWQSAGCQRHADYFLASRNTIWFLLPVSLFAFINSQELLPDFHP